MKQKQLSKSDIKEINEQTKKYGFEIDKKEKAMLVEPEEGLQIVLVEKKPLFFYHENKIVPTLKLLLEKNFLKKVVVDMNAVKFVASGADVMRPGIKSMDDFLKDEIVVIVDEKNKKLLSVGIALFSSSEISKMDKGKVIKALHYVGDKIWVFSL